MATLSLKDKVALVTGSGRENGIGAGIARTLAQNGAHVAIHYVSPSSKSRAEEVAQNIRAEFGTKATVVQGQVGEPGVAERMVKETLEGLSVDHLDILVNNAGVGLPNTLLAVTPEHLQTEFEVNVFGVVYLIQAAVTVGKMPPGGRVINIGTVASKQGRKDVPVYSASKAAQDSLTASWAGELGHSHGITVNTLAPGPVITDLSKPFLEAPDGSATEMQKTMYAATRGAARVGTADDIADAVLLLASEKSRWITAQWISVSGGIHGTM